MRLIDTHSHIYVDAFDVDRDDTIIRARDAGVVQQLLPAIDEQSYERLFSTCRAYPGYCVPMMGLHPTSVNDNPRWREAVQQVETYLAVPPPGLRFCAVGEIGLDFYWSDRFRAEQIEALRRQIEAALRHDLPISIHTRDAWPEMTELIETYRGRGLRGVFHAFSDTLETYDELRSSGDFFFGIGGVVTFKKSRLAEVVREMALEDILLETDCPYLTPAPHRGKRNEPAYVRFVCEKVAELKGMSPEEVADATTRNAERLFGLMSNGRVASEQQEKTEPRT